MASYVRENGSFGTVLECILVAVQNRAGDPDQLRMHYDVDGRTATWLADPVPDHQP